MSAYYLIKPYRNSQFLKEFSPQALPLVYLLVSILSLGLTRVFNALSERMSRSRLITVTYLFMALCQVGFQWLLSRFEKWGTIPFYFYSSVAFLLAVSAIWAFINELFDAAQGERCFGFVTAGATLGSIGGARLAAWLVVSPYHGYTLVFSAAGLCLALACILAAWTKRSGPRTPNPLLGPPSGEAAVRHNLLSDLLHIWRVRYLRAIAIMVVCLAIYNTSTDFFTQNQLDRKTSIGQYENCFGRFNQLMNHEQGRSPGTINPDGFAFIDSLRADSESEQTGRIVEFTRSHGLEEGAVTPVLYRHYQDLAELDLRKIYSDVFLYQGLLGVALLLVGPRLLFPRLGLAAATSILPLFALVGLTAQLLPLSLIALQVLLLVGGALNYSLNNATKELLYTVTDTETKFRHKPLIEGPGARLGDVIASLVVMSLGAATAIFNVGGDWKTFGFLGFCGLTVLLWLYSVVQAGRAYDRARATEGLRTTETPAK